MTRKNHTPPTNKLANKLTNKFQTILLLTGMAGLLGFLGWMLAGPAGVKVAMIITIMAFMFTPKLPSRMVMRSLKARPLHPSTTPELYRIVELLSRRAGLERIPTLYLTPSRKLNAFAVGSSEDSALGITRGLLSALSTREMAGILSHEITHIKNRDMQVMALSAVFGRITNFLSVTGQILLLISLPFAMMGKVTYSLFPLMILILAPTASMLLYLALSRTREFEADKGAVTLLNDPHALASALSKVEQYNTRTWQRMFFPVAVKPDQAPLLQSHPPTKERIKRLLAMAPPPRRPHFTTRGGRRIVVT